MEEVVRIVVSSRGPDYRGSFVIMKHKTYVLQSADEAPLYTHSNNGRHKRTDKMLCRACFSRGHYLPNLFWALHWNMRP